MTYLVLDLETVVDPSLPAPKLAKDGADVVPPPPYHQIVVLGAALLDAACRLRRIWVAGEGNGELAMLAALVAFLNAHLVARKPITIVGFNSRGFDLPVLVARCLRHGLSWPWYYRQRDVPHRFSADGHLDLMDFLTDHGAARFFSLDLAAKLVGMPGKIGCDGGEVAAMIARGELEQVRAYCLSDVAQTVAVFLRAQLLRGELDVHGYAKAAQRLLEVIEKEPRLAPLVPLIDRGRMLDVPSEETLVGPPASASRVGADPHGIRLAGAA